MEFKRKFEITLAIGLFDYIYDPLSMLKKMRSITSEKLIATFPRSGTVRAAVRKVRLTLYKCPVFFFSPQGVKRLLSEAGFGDIRLEIFGQLIFITCKPI